MATIKSHYAWIGPNDGYAAIFWHADSIRYYDWIGIYDEQKKGMNSYLKYQWASKGSGYVTNQYINTGLSARYYTWNSSTRDANFVRLNLDEVNEEGERTMTPVSVLATLSGSYNELMRSRDLDLEREVNAAGEFALKPGCWVEPYSSGYVRMNWTAAESQTSEDWVALYTDVHKENSDYISGTWQWAKDHSSYDTSQAYTPGIHARYIIKGASPYVAIRRSKPIAKGYFDLGSIYNTAQAEDGKKFDTSTARANDSVFRIMAD